jgi:lysophospholipase L1-like esterase
VPVHHFSPWFLSGFSLDWPLFFLAIVELCPFPDASEQSSAVMGFSVKPVCALGAFFAIFVLTAGETASAGPGASPNPNWVGAWASTQQIPEPYNALAPDDLHDATLRQIVHLALGGNELRLRLSNVFGTAPLHISAVRIARPLSPSTGSIDVSTDCAVTFSGNPDVTIPAGAEYLSDPVAFPVTAFSDLAISLYVEKPPAQQTGHPGAHATSFLVHGNAVSAVDLTNAKQVEHWYLISGVNVAAPSQEASIVTFGDSITDGHGSTTNGNDRWPDDLARRLQTAPATRLFGVLNAGTGGNRLLDDGLGPNGLARFDRDVLAQSGIRYLIVLEGINDLGMLTRDQPASPAEHEAQEKRVIAAYEQILSRAHAHGIRVLGGTMTPFVDSTFYHPSAADEAGRQAVNTWIRGPGHFDAVVDFDSVLRNPDHPDKLLPAYDSGDHLHPSPAGYRAMANAVPLAFFSNAHIAPHRRPRHTHRR